jgi:hypothetical protein
MLDFSDKALAVMSAINQLTKAQARAELLLKKTYPIGSSIRIGRRINSAAETTIIGIVRHYTMPTTAGLIVEVRHEDMVYWSECWHLPRYPGCVEVMFSDVLGPVVAEQTVVRKASNMG